MREIRRAASSGAAGQARRRRAPRRRARPRGGRGVSSGVVGLDVRVEAAGRAGWPRLASATVGGRPRRRGARARRGHARPATARTSLRAGQALRSQVPGVLEVRLEGRRSPRRATRSTLAGRDEAPVGGLDVEDEVGPRRRAGPAPRPALGSRGLDPPGLEAAAGVERLVRRRAAGCQLSGVVRRRRRWRLRRAWAAVTWQGRHLAAGACSPPPSSSAGSAAGRDARGPRPRRLGLEPRGVRGAGSTLEPGGDGLVERRAAVARPPAARQRPAAQGQRPRGRSDERRPAHERHLRGAVLAAAPDDGDEDVLERRRQGRALDGRRCPAARQGGLERAATRRGRRLVERRSRAAGRRRAGPRATPGRPLQDGEARRRTPGRRPRPPCPRMSALDAPRACRPRAAGRRSMSATRVQRSASSR
ncbi:MAG: hypothetical protein MZV63_72515 [Marinilabiliales bacterium]|nr:hypothetical protein [Marinilabiliales bacterium]